MQVRSSAEYYKNIFLFSGNPCMQRRITVYESLVVHTDARFVNVQASERWPCSMGVAMV